MQIPPCCLGNLPQASLFGWVVETYLPGIGCHGVTHETRSLQVNAKVSHTRTMHKRKLTFFTPPLAITYQLRKNYLGVG